MTEEHCSCCGRTYINIGWWKADDYLYAKITGKVDGSGLYCPDCFGLMARKKGILLRWYPEIDNE